jgi:hypothetical protein
LEKVQALAQEMGAVWGVERESDVALVSESDDRQESHHQDGRRDAPRESHHLDDRQDEARSRCLGQHQIR